MKRSEKQMALQIDSLLAKLHKVSSDLRVFNDLSVKIDDDAMPMPADRELSTARTLMFIWKSRNLFFDMRLVEDPGWLILLSLKIAQLNRQRVSTSALCIDSGVPNTTALRWIKSMDQKGLLNRETDNLDSRRVYVCLSDEASTLMSKYLTNVSQYLDDRDKYV